MRAAVKVAKVASSLNYADVQPLPRQQQLLVVHLYAVGSCGLSIHSDIAVAKCVIVLGHPATREALRSDQLSCGLFGFGMGASEWPQIVEGLFEGHEL